MKYKILRTDTADIHIRKIIMFIAERFDSETAETRLDELEKSIMKLSDNPHLGEQPRYPILRRQGYYVLILEKDLVFYKINEERKTVIIYAVFDQRQDYLKLIRGL